MHCLRTTLLLIASSITSLAFTQSPQAFLQEAMEKYGPWKSLPSFYYYSHRVNYNKWQSYSFNDPKPTNNTVELYMDMEKERYYLNTVFRSPGGYVFDFVTIGQDSSRYLYDKGLARNGKTLLKQGKDSYQANKTTALQSFPFYLLKTVAESKDSLVYSTDNKEVQIRRIFKDGTTQDLVFEGESGRLKKIMRVANGQKSERLFESYQTIDGLVIATTIRQLVDGSLTGIETLKSFKANKHAPDSYFSIPAKYQLPQSTAPKPLAAKEIAKDVYLVESVGGDRNMLFINMNDYIVLTEAPVSPVVTKAVLELVRKTIPGKPIRYVHLSHFHNDHTTGVRQLVAEGVRIITTPPTEAPVRAILKGGLGAFNDDYAKSPTEPAFDLFQGKKILEDQNHRIEFHQVPNTHAEGMSFLYLPKEGIIYEGDLLTIPEDGTITPAIQVNKEFHQYLLKNNIKFHRIIGHHSFSFITPVLFQQMLKAK